MQFFILGLAALVLGLIVLQAFTRANPAVMARQIRRGIGAVALAAAAVFLVRGLIHVAVPLGTLGWWLIWGPNHLLGGGLGSAAKSPSQSSRVVTDHLEMELDHDTGEMRGRVLRGMFRGRSIEGLKPAELALLWQDCRFSDAQSAQLIEAYLDRAYPAWREDMARGEAEMSAGTDGRMTPEEAYRILGLTTNASADEIRRAHRELMLKLHPDRGGSTYLASKINEAKDVLLGRG